MICFTLSHDAVRPTRHLQKIHCSECDGTGSTVPHCGLCQGQRSIRLKKAYRHGWKLSDLDDDGDGYCRCPECDYEAADCPFCWGDGQADQFVLDQQNNRILIHAKHGFIPPTFRYDHHGFISIEPNMALLSRQAASQCRDAQQVHWFCSVFGDELHLREEANDAAQAAWQDYRAICKAYVQSQRALKEARHKMTEAAKQKHLSIAAQRAILRKALRKVPIACL